LSGGFFGVDLFDVVFDGTGGHGFLLGTEYLAAGGLTTFWDDGTFILSSQNLN
jgi:hypothetical protein